MKILISLISSISSRPKINNSAEQNPSREANSSSASQEIPRTVWYPKVHYRIHNRPPLIQRSYEMFRNTVIFYGEELLGPRLTPKLKDHPLSAVCGSLFNTFADTFHNWRPFLHPEPEDEPCCGERDPLTRETQTHLSIN